jgi:prepilin-type N-terminal cleavage/methylation domain-containing protein
MLSARFSGHHYRRRSGAFTLVEIMVVVVIISVLAAVSVPAIQRIQRKAKTTTIANDFRTFAAAFDTYAQETGTWPADTAAGAFPAAMAQRINKTAWLRKTPIGGQYNWESNRVHYGIRYRAAITIGATAKAPLPLDVNTLNDLEHAIDGADQLDWFGGSFRLGTGSVPLYAIQQ